MPGQLIECIPNFSEARKPDVVAAILEVISNTPNIQILDTHSDKDHNRTVVTFIGPPKDVEKAAFLGIKKAAELINLDNHTGSHPRLGATDVVPFVPISGVSMEECVKIARHLAEKVGKELHIPVYLYEEAAIRKGEYEVLKKEITTKVERKPDFGPASLTPAGATVIGARNPLIAFNIYLDTDDLFKAKAIAEYIRESSGGLPCVKALGMMVHGLAQVSMNLTDFHKTSILQVFDSVRIQASKYNTRIHHSELIGLIPQESLLNTVTLWKYGETE
jgi:glutamate formiminotransferase